MNSPFIGVEEIDSVGKPSGRREMHGTVGPLHGPPSAAVLKRISYHGDSVAHPVCNARWSRWY